MTYRPGMDIIVVNHRTPRDLVGFCESLTLNPPKNIDYGLRIFNVAPLVTDIRVASEWGAKLSAQVTGNEQNVGYATAVNTCARRGGREVIAIFNADVEILPDALDVCYEALMSEPSWGILGPRQIDDRGTFTHAGILGRRDKLVFRGWHETLSDKYKDILTVPTVMGSAMFIKRECWNELSSCPPYQDHVRSAFGTGLFGAFLPTFLFFEETFCCYHAVEHNWDVIYYGPATLMHKWHHSIHTNMDQSEEVKVIDKSYAQFRAACDAVHGMPHE